MQLHKWLPKINKQKFTHPLKLQVGVVVETEFVHCCKYSGGSAEYYIYQKTCYTGLPNLSATVRISTKTETRSELSADLTGMSVEVG